MFIEENIFDFKPVGQAIKNAREDRKITRESLAEKFDMDERYLARIENEGVHPGFELFCALVLMFDISVDQYFYPDRVPAKSTRRRKIESLMDSLDEEDLIIVEAAISGILKAAIARNNKTPSLTYTVNKPY